MEYTYMDKYFKESVLYKMGRRGPTDTAGQNTAIKHIGHMLLELLFKQGISTPPI